MNDDERKSYEIGRHQGAHSSIQDWDAYVRGKNDRERWEASNAQPQSRKPSFDFEPKRESGGGGSSSGGNPLVVFLLPVTLFTVPVLGPLLYPFTAAGIFGVWYAARRWLPEVTANPRYLLVVPLVVAAISLWIFCRTDQRIADNFLPYRIVRHLARLAVFACIALITLNTRGGATFISIEHAIDVQATVQHISTIAITVLVMHFLLMREFLRELWHSALMVFGLNAI